MKRNHTTKRQPKSGVSPYKRYGKRPYQYSQKHMEWQREARAGAVKEI